MGMLIRCELRYRDLTFGTEGYGAAMASHGHSDNGTQQSGGARTSTANTDQQEEAQWKEKTRCDPEKDWGKSCQREGNSTRSGREGGRWAREANQEEQREESEEEAERQVEEGERCAGSCLKFHTGAGPMNALTSGVILPLHLLSTPGNCVQHFLLTILLVGWIPLNLLSLEWVWSRSLTMTRE